MAKFDVRNIYFTVFRILLLLAALIALYDGIWMAFILSIITFFLLYLPKIIDPKKKIEFPTKIEMSILILIYILLFFENSSLFKSSQLVLRVTFHLIASIIIGLVGFTMIIILNKEKKVVVTLSPIFASIFAFCFSMTIGTIWQVFRYVMDYLFNISVGEYYVSDALGFITVHTLGAALVSFFGYLYLNGEDKYFLRSFLRDKLGIKHEDTSKEILKLVKKGESESLEFKQTLRTNVHTNEHDKRMEIASLKTLVAYLNCSGGTLLVGIDDHGKIKGMEKDNFKSDDKLKLHLTNLIKKHIGSEFSSFIKFETYQIKNKTILKVDCNKSDKAVFLKDEGKEIFYIRSGPATIQLESSKLLSYAKRRFKK